MTTNTQLHHFYDPAWEAKLRETSETGAAHYEVKGAIARPGLEIEIRRFFWDKQPEPTMTTMELCYLSLALTPRPIEMETNYLCTWQQQAFHPMGNCCFVPARQKHLSRACIGEYQEVCCLFDMALFAPYVDWEWTPLELAACLDIKNINIRTGLLRLAEEVAHPGPYSNDLVDATFQSLLVELSRHFKATRVALDSGAGKLMPRHLNLISDRVRNSLDQDLHIDTLAALCGLSGRHLARMFKKTTGRTLGEFIAEERINHAKFLLSQPDLLIKEIAFSCGFHSQSSFSQAFRNATGKTPSQFRSRLEI